MKPVFFASPAAFRAWLEENHHTADEVRVGFYRKDSGKTSITWAEAVDQALCFGWIDGVRHRVDEVSYSNRFTPRQARSNWSSVNIARVAVLTEQGLMNAAGIAAFERRSQARSGIYSYEQRHAATLTRDQEKAFRANRKAWSFFQAQAPSYQRIMVYHIASAKKDETKRRRLDALIRASADGKRVQ